MSVQPFNKRLDSRETSLDRIMQMDIEIPKLDPLGVKHIRPEGHGHQLLQESIAMGSVHGHVHTGYLAYGVISVLNGGGDAAFVTRDGGIRKLQALLQTHYFTMLRDDKGRPRKHKRGSTHIIISEVGLLTIMKDLLQTENI
ncbi:uncharacterized protein ATC70_009892 [Mucor velutinosus]|uniref:Uncharacterized protein n=1 Tax=Mucor velutinosus TaxID=708070 RepID=A0AAN7DP86_9FUNG|nr:hypothetical protein ATC70_009892 [Mucor velutinosus]